MICMLKFDKISYEFDRNLNEICINFDWFFSNSTIHSRSLDFQLSNYFIKINKYFDKIFAKLPNWIFSGGVVEHPVTDVTPTMLTPNVISTLRQADHLANQVLNANQESKNNLSQMPLVLIPIHFDRYECLLNSRFELSGLLYLGKIIKETIKICKYLIFKRSTWLFCKWRFSKNIK